MMSDKSLRVQILAAFAAVYFCWGSTYIAIRFAVESIPPFLMAGGRFLIAGGLLYVWARARGAALPTLKQWIPAAIIGTLLLVCGNGGVVLAEKTIPSGMVSLLIAMVPIYFAMLEWIKPGGSAPGIRVSIGLVIGVTGLLMLIGPSNILSGTSSIDLRGVAYVFGASLCWSIGSMYSRTVRISESPTMGIAMQTLAGGLILSILSVAFNEPQHVDFSAIPMRAIVSVIYLIVFGSIVGFSAYVWLLQQVKPTLVATYAYVNPVVAVLLGWAMAGEPLTGQTLTAAAVILSAVWLITQAPKQLEPKPVDVKLASTATK